MQNSPSDHSDKENQHASLSDDDLTDCNVSDRRLKRKRQNLFCNFTPLATQRGQHLNSTGASGLDRLKFATNKRDVVLVNDSLESREDSSCCIVHEVVCLQESKERSSSPDCKPNKELGRSNVSNSSRQGQSLDENVVLQNSTSCPNDSIAVGLVNGSYSTCSSKANTCGFDRCQSSHVTSTPVYNINIPPAITGSSARSDSQSSNSILMDGKVVLEPLRITPIQWQKCLSLSNEKPERKNCSQLMTGDVDQCSDGQKTSGVATRHNSSVELKECVVSLEKLRITPLKKRSRYHLGDVTGSDACGVNRGKSQLSFVVSYPLQ